MTASTGHEHGAVMGIACDHVLTRERAVTLVEHCPDGTWSFICGEVDPDHEDPDRLSAICAGCGFADLVDGLEMADLAPGWIAERPDAGARWVIRQMTPEELVEFEEE